MDEQNNVVTPVTPAAPAPQGNGGLAIKIVSLALGVTGLVWSLTSFFTSCGAIASAAFVIYPLITLAMCIVALVLGIKGRKQGGKLTGMATAGMICGIIGIVFSVLGFGCAICTCACASSVSTSDYQSAIDALSQLG